jgi:CheY-like chemotaxis protein
MPRGAETILVAEDNDAVRGLAREVLTGCGYHVLEGASGPASLAIGKNYQGSIQLLMTDVVMPGMNGRELANQLLSRHPQMRILYMSGYADDAIVHHGVLDAGTNFIQKPFSPDALARKVRLILDEPPRSDA